MTTENDSGPKKEEISIAPELKTAIKIGAAFFLVMLCVIFIAVPLMNAYNLLVDADVQVSRAAANVKTDLERRADLLPNLAETVKGSATFEYKTQHDTYVEVAQARGAADAYKVKSQIAATPADQIAATNLPSEQQLTQILGNFVKLQEQYPDVKLNTVQQFREFGAQVTATENQILMDRQTYNNAVMQYQSICRSFPTVLVAQYYGFNPDKYKMYEPRDLVRAETVPTITFDFAHLG